MSLDDENLRNLIEFYNEELISVINGEPVTSVFTPQQRRNLRDAGILKYRNRTWIISEKVRAHIKL